MFLVKLTLESFLVFTNIYYEQILQQLQVNPAMVMLANYHCVILGIVWATMTSFVINLWDSTISKITSQNLQKPNKLVDYVLSIDGGTHMSWTRSPGASIFN